MFIFSALETPGIVVPRSLPPRTPQVTLARQSLPAVALQSFPQVSDERVARLLRVSPPISAMAGQAGRGESVADRAPAWRAVVSPARAEDPASTLQKSAHVEDAHKTVFLATDLCRAWVDVVSPRELARRIDGEDKDDNVRAETQILRRVDAIMQRGDTWDEVVVDKAEDQRWYVSRLKR